MRTLSLKTMCLNRLFMIFLLILIVIVNPGLGNGTIKVGHLYVYDQLASEAALNLSVQLIRDRGLISPDTRIEIIQEKGCEEHDGPAAAYYLYNERKVDVIIGPACSSGMKPIGKFAAAWNLTLIGYMSAGKEMKDKTIFPTLARVTSNTMDELAAATAQVLHHHNWKRVALIWNSSHVMPGMFGSAARETFRQMNINIAVDIDAGRWLTSDDMVSALEKIRNNARIVVVVLGQELHQNREFMIRAHEQKMTSTDYVYITPVTNKQPGRWPNPWMHESEDQKEKNGLARQSFQRALEIVNEGTEDKAYLNFLERVEKETNVEPWLQTWRTYTYPSWLGATHDSLLLFGQAYNKCNTMDLSPEEQCNWRNGRHMFDMFRNKEFRGASGKVVMNDNAERVPGYLVKRLPPDPNAMEMEVFFKLEVMQKETSDGRLDPVRMMIPMKRIQWETEGNVVPRDTPACGFDGSKCPPSYTAIIVLSVLGGTAVMALVIFFLIKRKKRQFEAELFAMSWKIAPLDLTFETTLSKSSKSLTPHITDLEPLGGIGVSYPPGWLMADSSTSRSVSPSLNDVADQEDTFQRIHNGTAWYHGVKVAVHNFYTREEVTLKKREDLLVLKAMKDIQHENLNPFVGICVLNLQKITIVWSYCSKGSLEDIIFNPEIQLDMVFKGSILKDIVKALEYLHRSKLQSHGSLCLSNCLVDSHWQVKLTDFGIQQVIQAHRQRGVIVWHRDTPEKLFHVAPEILRTYNSFGPRMLADQKADIYGFGMIMYQVLLRGPLFDTKLIPPTELLQQLKKPGSMLIRPIIPSKNTHHEDLLKLMAACWHEEPVHRPNLTRIRNVVFGCVPDKSKSLIDHMIKMMENYQDNLERMVQSRTKQLMEERHRSDELLSRILPKITAEKINQGMGVDPETFESATVCFANVPHLYSICSKMEPIKAVKLLDEINCIIDDVIGKFDAYKIETVGDSFLIASGLPERNGTRHCMEIVCMAFEMLMVISEYQNPDLFGQTVSLQCGIHTGPVATGVIGRSRPQYCVFGDTISVAYHVEKTGQPRKIHITKQTRDILGAEEMNSFVCVSRGLIESKGKGLLETFWLFEKPDSAHMAILSEKIREAPIRRHIGPLKPIKRGTFMNATPAFLHERL